MIDSFRAAYGEWKSPITSDLIVSDTIRLSQVMLDGDDIYWIESRPSEAGRNVIVRRTQDGKIQDVTPKNLNVRTRAHEYGGGAATIKNSTLYFSHDKDQRLYQQSLNTNPVAITPEKPYRFADYIVDEKHHQAICILEDHSIPANEATNSLAAINLNNGSIRLLASGNDFYSSPGLSPDGRRLAWLTWNHPNMPWDSTELWSGEMNASGLVNKKLKVAGGKNESIFQPQFSPDGTLYFISDKNGWWNIYRISNGAAEPVLER